MGPLDNGPFTKEPLKLKSFERFYVTIELGVKCSSFSSSGITLYMGFYIRLEISFVFFFSPNKWMILSAVDSVHRYILRLVFIIPTVLLHASSQEKMWILDEQGVRVSSQNQMVTRGIEVYNHRGVSVDPYSLILVLLLHDYSESSRYLTPDRRPSCLFYPSGNRSKIYWQGTKMDSRPSSPPLP